MQDSSDIYGEGQGDEAADSGDNDSGQQTAVIPSEMCPGMKVGDEITLRIVGSDENSYEVAYDKNEEPGDDSKMAPAEVPAGSTESMME